MTGPIDVALRLTRSDLFARLRGAAPAVRPPRIVAEHLFLERCTRCDACAGACPARIIVRGSGGFPVLDVSQRGCTLCGACAEACRDGCFDRAAPTVVAAIAAVGEACLERHGTSCRACESACEADALRFRPLGGGRSAPTIRADLCTGCGGCVAPCPVGAFALVPHHAPASPAVAAAEVRP